ncbi:hypothetical protein GGP51_002756 [Salinibacter ruber]|uniref:GIY-YIG nuclease family protein n=1 Tax=Salinibacter ruber TaxID=146919 RepID=UPI00216715A1|nr:hypothetical protein [Salinibacter ruber]
MSGSRPKTVQNYLPDGNARSVRVAEITSRTVQGTEIPRQKLQRTGEQDETCRVGVYFLFGDQGDDATKPAAYIGETENCFERLRIHQGRKDFWTTAVAITSRTRSFTKAHAKRLEYDCIRVAREAGRFRLKNDQVPTEPHVPEPMLAELQDNFEAVQTLFSTLGHPILDPLATEQKRSGREVLRCAGRGAEARGTYTEDGLVVFEGSKASMETVSSAPDAVLRRRKSLREEGTLAEEDGALVFTEDHSFGSPSGAAGAVLGRSSNGWQEWENGDGRTLDEIERQS